MKRFFFVGIILVFTLTSVFGQAEKVHVSFLENLPVIDGLPDEALNNIAWQNFSYSEKTNVQNEDVKVRYKIAYGLNFLYLIIESNSDSITFRDRSYQNGDGFHLVIAKPDSGRATNEFYVLRFSPGDPLKNIQSRKGLWYYNIALSGKSLSGATQYVCRSANGKSYFELLLPWNEVPPYHPLFLDRIGLNLCFVKAIGTKEKNYYLFKSDDKIQSELSKREYLLADFEPPLKIKKPYSFAKIEQNNIQTGNSVKIKMVSFAQTRNIVTYSVTICSADNYVYTELFKEVQLVEGINNNEFVLPVEHLISGGYKVVWKCSDHSEGDIPLTVLPEISFAKEKAALDALKDKMSQGDYYTLLFMLQNIVKDNDNVKRYETAGDIRERYMIYSNYLVELRKENNLLSDKRGLFRRAFLSGVDQTLQPYSIKIPDNFDRNKKYPLYVMLHGSGSDDQYMLNNTLIGNDFIGIAPFGRGTSNCFTTDKAEVDVREAIEDAIKNYPIDTSRIIIAGFSMGGYGAYRIFYEYPKLFKGIAVFSGHPSLATKWIGVGHPDFLNAKYLKPFKNIPVFIYHSRNDLNCPYNLTEQLVEKLTKAGAKVAFITTSAGGHGMIDDKNLPTYYKWLDKIIEK